MTILKTPSSELNWDQTQCDKKCVFFLLIPDVEKVLQHSSISIEHFLLEYWQMNLSTFYNILCDREMRKGSQLFDQIYNMFDTLVCSHIKMSEYIKAETVYIQVWN